MAWDFQVEPTPRAYYYIARAYEALGKNPEAEQAYKESTHGVGFLSGDRDSWNADNFYAVLSLEKLGDKQRAESLIPHFQGFAEAEMNETNPVHRGKARYLLALVANHAGKKQEAVQYLKDSSAALPHYLPPRYALRGDELDSLVYGYSRAHSRDRCKTL
ncbi:MAG: hypothetical protein M3Y72_00855 [Acidobacteriota bacterium]|nr:hypothetical protein [Acidobacteriota bacterium]